MTSNDPAEQVLNRPDRLGKYVPAYTGTDIESTPLFFNHIPKTGGTSLTGILFAIAVYRKRPYRFIPKRYGDRRRRLPLKIRFSRAMVYAGESRFGMHAALKLQRRLNLVTVVRDPVEGIVSQYFWKCRQENALSSISPDHFGTFLASRAHNNICAEFLAGGREKLQSADALDYCRQNLECYFAVATTAKLDKLASYLLSRHGGPSVMFDDAKKETDPRKVEFETLFRDDIMASNELDQELYSEALRHELRWLESGWQAGESNPDTMAIYNEGGKNFSFETDAAGIRRDMSG